MTGLDDQLADLLQVGGRSNSLGRTAEVVDVVVADPARMRELLDCVQDEDAWVRMRAVDAVEKVCRVDPGRVAAYVEELLTTWTTSDQASVQWHLAQVLRQVELSPEQQERAIAWLVARVATTDVDWIVATEVLRTLVGFASSGATGADVVAGLAEVQRGHRSASVRRKADRFLEHLQG